MPLSFYPRVWLNPILDPLFAIEREMIKAVIAMEEPEITNAIQSQFELFNYAQRLERGMEVIFYIMRFGIFHIRKEIKIKCVSKQISWGTFTIQVADGSRFYAKIFILNGSLSCILYSKRVNRLVLRDAKIVDVKRDDWDSPDAAVKYLRSSLMNFEQLEREIYKYDTLPKDIVLHEIRDMYEVVVEEGLFFNIGEKIDSGSILSPSNSSNLKSGIYFGDFDSGRVLWVAEDLRSFMEMHGL